MYPHWCRFMLLFFLARNNPGQNALLSRFIMILVLGEILFDVFPTHKRMGGASFNFAFHLKKLGFPVRFVSRVGKDDLGRQILDFLTRHQFDVKDIQIDPDHDTGTVRVTMDNGTHAFAITPDTAWTHLALDQTLAQCLQTPWNLLYFGSLVQSSQSGRRVIRQVIRQKKPETKVFCDINLRPDFHTPALINDCLGAADILKLNQEELRYISDNCGQGAAPSMDRLMAFHDLELIILTLGRHGSQWITRDKNYHCPSFLPQKIADTVGAGDAYAAVSAAGWLMGLPIKISMDLASKFAGYICTIPGALSEDEALYTKFRQRIHPNRDHNG